MPPMTFHQRWDRHREIHKGVRFALFAVTTRAGTADAGDELSVRSLLDLFDDVAVVVRAHHAQEDECWVPVIRRYVDRLGDEVAAAHVASDRQLAALHDAAYHVRQAAPVQRAALLHAFHLDLADYTVNALTHLDVEERLVMPAVSVALIGIEPDAVGHHIGSAVPPPELFSLLRFMVPAMNFTERLDVLGALYACLPAEEFELVRKVAALALASEDYDALALAAGFG
jgi:hypothetical protein